MAVTAFSVGSNEGSAYWMLGGLVTMKATAQQTGGAFGLVEEVLNKAAEPPPHVHHREDEAFYVLDGELTIRVGDEIFRATRGAFVFCPRGIPHQLTVESPEVRMLTLVTPGGVEGLWQQLGEPARSRTLPPEPTEPDINRVVRLAAEYGAEILPSWP
jgi:quercetin dioxygenase-like cupin family protein